MTPKEKAGELVERFIPQSTRYFPDFNAGQFVGNTIDERSTFEFAKQCAIILCDEILPVCKAADAFDLFPGSKEQTFVEYWQAVRKEIETL